MKYNDFIKRLEQIPKSCDEYLRLGYADDFIHRISDGLFPKKKHLFIDDRKDSDEILKLVNTYNMEFTNIGMISFLDRTKLKGERTFFGKFEVDDLVVDHFSGEIRCYEEDSNHMLSRCAIDGSSFFDALIEAASFLMERMVNEELYNDQVKNEEIANKCAELAGGVEFKDFYRIMLS